MDDPNTFMLDSLRELQTTLLLLMERTSRTQVHEGWSLEWALTEVLTAYRDLRERHITWVQAAQIYQTASNVQLDCDRAVLDVEMSDSYDWQMAKQAVTP